MAPKLTLHASYSQQAIVHHDLSPGAATWSTTMRGPSPSELRHQNASLLPEVCDSILEMAEIARSNEANEELKIFYSHLGFHCARFRDHARYIASILLQMDAENTDTILNHLGSLIPKTGLPELPRDPGPFFRLQALKLHWSYIREEDEDSKLTFIRRWLDCGASENARDELDKSLEQCGDALTSQLPRNAHPVSEDNLASLKISEPSYAVWKVAQSMFNALLECKKCTCQIQHDFGAKLSLGTYRMPAKKETQSLQRRPPRRPRGHDSAGVDLEFDMFLSMEQHWEEVHVQSARQRTVRFAGPDDECRSQCHTENRRSKKIQMLCKPINETRKRALERLILKLTSGQLFQLGFERSQFRVDRSTEPISLSQCLQDRRQFFTEKAKRILSLVLGYAVLHLHGTSWLRPGWSSSSIKFFQTTSSKTPLRPFIQTQLPKASVGDTDPDFELVVQGDGSDYNTDDNLESEHRCPPLVALAVILMEVYFVMPFKSLAKSHGVDLIEDPTGSVSYADALLVFYGEEEDNIEGCISQIPEDCPLVTVIERCLDADLWEDENGEGLDDDTQRPRIYQEVVRPLEAHLSQGFSQIPLEDIDKYAQDLDFGNWGQAIRLSASEPLAELSRTPTPSSGVSWPFFPPNGAHTHFQHSLSFQNHLHHQASQFLSLSSLSLNEYPATNGESDFKESQFFDDETDQGDVSGASINRYLRWKSNYEVVYNKFITNSKQPTLGGAIKIAILDTGIDRDHSFFDAREENIKRRFNWYNEGAKKRVPDRHGHGTFNASLILDYAPDAELYVAKIADKENAQPTAHVVANAINCAVSEWKVDIISMSFGWPTRDFEGYEELEEAIDRAQANKVLMFAAASNSGGRRGRAYPARSPNVICIHSTDTYGNRSEFSPTASPDDMNLATVGQFVQSAWPYSLCDDKTNPQCIMNKSGTSYATPIAAGIGAFLLQYARLHLSDRAARALKHKDRMEAVLKAVAERGQSYKTRDGYYYIEISLEKDTLFGKDKDLINLKLEDILTS